MERHDESVRSEQEDLVTARTFSRRGFVVAVAATSLAVIVHLGLQAGMMLRWPGWRLDTFRNYFASDQFAYLAIVTDVSRGESWHVEPYTLTGATHYPRLWYVLLGEISRVTGASPASLWTLGGLAVQAVLVAAVATACTVLSRRPWTGAFGFVPFVLGTGSWISHGGDSWMTTLDSHAVLWGPFGVLYTLNGETVALGLGGAALLAILVAAGGRIPSPAVWPTVMGASLVIGLLANVQTYAFLTSSFLLAGSAAATALYRQRAWARLWFSAALLVLVLLLGSAWGDKVSPLFMLAAAMVPSVPGLLLLNRLTRWRTSWCVAAAGLGALPQVASTVLGLRSGDPFLVYREASSKDLGVPAVQGLVAGGAVLLLMAIVVVAGLVRRRSLWVGVPSAFALVWGLLATNDRWGANQEPYRFWLDTLVLAATVMIPLVVWVSAEGLQRSGAVPGPADRAVVGQLICAQDGEWDRRSRSILAGALVLGVLLAAAWSWDFVRFRSAVSSLGYVPLYSQPYVAERELADRTDGSLVLPDACIDPAIFKATWGGPVAYYNLGLAWPSQRKALDRVLIGRLRGSLDVGAVRRAHVGWILRDPSCAVNVTRDVGASLVATYPLDGGGSRELWRINH